MKKLVLGLVAILGFSSIAAAKDICVSSIGLGPIVFQKVKRLKAGRTVPLSGILVFGSAAIPIDGTALMRPDGTTVQVGIFVHSMGAPGSGLVGVTETLTVDATFTGTGNYDNTGNMQADGSDTWTSIDCTTVTIP